MLIHDLLGYSDKYPLTSGCLWNYSRDGMNGDANENNNAGSYKTNKIRIITSKSFECKTKGQGTHEMIIVH